MTFREHLATLAPLEQFSREAFGPSNRVSEAERGFFLCLAQIQNDLKDLTLLNVLIIDLPELTSGLISPQVGECGGIQNHLFRIVFGVMNELLYLIRQHPKVIEGEFFQTIYDGLPKEAKDSWDQILRAIDGKRVITDFSKALVRLRKAVSFHYDPKEMLRGYERAFSQPLYGTPKVSRGKNMQQSRFYFADAASQAFMVDIVGGSSIAPQDWINQVRFAH